MSKTKKRNTWSPKEVKALKAAAAEAQKSGTPLTKALAPIAEARGVGYQGVYMKLRSLDGSPVKPRSKVKTVASAKRGRPAGANKPRAANLASLVAEYEATIARADALKAQIRSLVA